MGINTRYLLAFTLFILLLMLGVYGYMSIQPVDQAVKLEQSYICTRNDCDRYVDKYSTMTGLRVDKKARMYHDEMAIRCGRMKSGHLSVAGRGGWCIHPSDFKSWRKERSKYFFHNMISKVHEVFIKDSDLIVEFGAGNGHYSKYLKQQGIDARPYDGSINIELATEGLVTFMDLTYPHPAWEKIPCGDVVLSLEVFEHIDKKYESILVDNIINHTNDRIIISVAEPSQAGNGHVNTRSNTYVIKLFENRGFRYEREKTSQVRKVIDPKAFGYWFKNTIMLFSKVQ